MTRETTGRAAPARGPIEDLLTILGQGRQPVRRRGGPKGRLVMRLGTTQLTFGHHRAAPQAQLFAI